MKRWTFLGSVTAALVAAGVANAQEVNVAFLPCGTINDQSWSQAGYVGMTTAKEALAAEGITMNLSYTENTPPAQVEAAARDYAERGNTILVLHCGTYSEAALNVAKAFPNVTVLHSTPAASETPPNFFYYDIAQQEGSFVGGYLSGLVSETGQVAVVGSFTFPPIVRQVEGFLLGARYARPDIKTLQSYINSFNDAGKAQEAAQAQIDSGADIIYGATDQAARGIFKAAQDAGVYAVAAYADQASLAPDAVLASVPYDFAPLLKLMVVDAAKGQLDKSKSYVLGMKDGYGSLVYNPQLESKVSAEVKGKVATLIDDIISGRLVVPFDLVDGSAKTVDLNSLMAH